MTDLKDVTKETLKVRVKEKCRILALNYLESEKRNKSKIKLLEFPKLELQKYLKTNNIGIRQKKLLFKIRTRMIKTSENKVNHSIRLHNILYI